MQDRELRQFQILENILKCPTSKSLLSPFDPLSPTDPVWSAIITSEWEIRKSKLKQFASAVQLRGTGVTLQFKQTPFEFPYPDPTLTGNSFLPTSLATDIPQPNQGGRITCSSVHACRDPCATGVRICIYHKQYYPDTLGSGVRQMGNKWFNVGVGSA
jgi:hypothetical protein